VVQVEVPSEQAELAADALWQARPSAVLEVALAGDRIRLTADVADLAAIDPIWCPVVLDADDDGYLDAWRTWAQPIRAGRRVVLHPAWIPPPDPPADGDLVVVLDPGRAFGSGSHESTRLAVAAIEGLGAPVTRVLDVGCGSGVLAVVAALLGAAEVVAVDVDPEAVTATGANAAANGVADRVRACSSPVAELDEPYDLVVGNIGGRTLFDLAGDLVRLTRPGGGLVLSGILEDRVDALVAACAGCAEVRRTAEAGWGCVLLRRDAS
jgi:ribosomal protein L11 methyltransferase